MTDNYVEPMKVHLAGSDLPLISPPGKRCRYGVALRTFELTTNDPVQMILPQNLHRREAYIQPMTQDITLHTSLADAEFDTHAGITVPAANTCPYPLHTTDAVWATASADDLPVSVSVASIIETVEP